MTITIRPHDRQCRDCHGEGFILLEPVNPGGSRVSERCACQPVPEETDAQYYLRIRAEELAYMEAHPTAEPDQDTYEREHWKRREVERDEDGI